MKILAVLAATLLMSATVFSGVQMIYSETNLSTVGFDYVDSLEKASHSELSFKLAIIGNNSISNMS